jgi:hypothetical protein
MYQVKYRLKSISPYIQNNPASEIEGVKTGSGKTRIGKKEMNPDKTGYKNEIGFYIPARQINGLKFRAGMKVKLGKTNIANFMKACVFCDRQEFQMTRKGKPIEQIEQYDFVYNDPIIRKDGQMVFKPRVAFNEWEAEIILNVTEEAIPKEKILEVLIVGGLYIGIGARRPEYGRFMVEEI